jgi:hypothetical protein
MSSSAGNDERRAASASLRGRQRHLEFFPSFFFFSFEQNCVI